MKPFRGIVVGVETLDHSQSAIGWAMHEAATRRLDVLLAHVVPLASTVPGSLGASAGWPVVPTVEIHRAANASLEQAVTYARECEPHVKVTATVRSGDPANELLELASDADLLVVGTRESSRLRSALLGSTSIKLAHTADSPFVVVRNGWQPPPTAPVVVGVEPSTDSAPVLAAAFEYASLHQRELHAVFCWEPFIYAPHEHWPVQAEQVRTTADVWLSEALSGWRSQYPDVPVVRDLVCDYPAAGLVKASLDAAIVIVGVGGSRISRTLGSVAATVLHQAGCPVEVVPR